MTSVFSWQNSVSFCPASSRRWDNTAGSLRRHWQPGQRLLRGHGGGSRVVSSAPVPSEELEDRKGGGSRSAPGWPGAPDRGEAGPPSAPGLQSGPRADLWASRSVLMAKNLSAKAGYTRHMSSIPGLERSPGGGNGSPFRYSCLEDSRDRGDWWAAVHGVARYQT